jgi:hypothetical protein
MMTDKWVDTNKYFGPDRRRRSGSKRWGDRRGLDEAGRPPALGSMLRRVRVQLMSQLTPDERKLTLQILSAAIGDAERQRFHRCADALKQADRALRTSGPNAVAEAEARLIEAMDYAGNQR